jgi:hypothetical protein
VGAKKPQGEIVVAPGSARPVAKVRSTIVAASLAEIKADGYLDAYVKVLPEGQQDILLTLTAGQWVPVATAAAHYRACDALGFAPSEQIARGRRAIDRVGQTIFGTAIQGAKSMGATPWTIFGQFPRFWARAYDGGAIAVYKAGPKDANLEVTEFSLLEIPYFRRALQGWVTAMLAAFCQTIYLHEVSSTNMGPHEVRYRAQWV